MKNFETPQITILHFHEEDIVTASGVSAQEMAKKQLTTENSDLLSGRDVLTLENVVVFSF